MGMLDREREISETKVRLCLDCGKCTVVCPVAQHDPDFNPRLVTQRNLRRNSHEPHDETIWSCTSCYMCVERCNYYVKFPEFIQALRSEAVSDGMEPQCSHGGALQALMHLMAGESLRQDRLQWLPDDIEVSKGSDTVFFVGCAPYFDVVFSDLEVNTLEGVKGALKLLNRAGIPFDLLENERCCGRDLLMQGDREGFVALARANAEEFARRGVKRIITNCPECQYTLRADYPKVDGETGIEILHVTQVLAPVVESGDLSLGSVESCATYHDPCTLGRCSRVFDQPRAILEAVPGLELAEMEHSREKSLCCGAVPWVHCGSVNRRIQEQRLDQAEAAGAGVLVTSCPKCQIHLRCAQKSNEGKARQVEIRDLADLLAFSVE
jgi:Fe-S oxidoreductase